MKSSQEILWHVQSVLASIYERPRMYAATAGELDAVLLQYHHLWGYITERDGELTAAHAKLSGDRNGTEPMQFDAVLDHWRQVDQMLGIATLSEK